ncbi:MAG: helicase-exonuclease AddAB subunit AddA [Lachnospiraceae bacterium]|nr:helicase-exonuclease AddAB subunit AddA [Lachnospiraceae bacterium]
MATIKWSNEQQKIIDLRDRTLLVAAAAGSGKTAVLVERILARISDEASPVDIDHFLVVTFTNAAAAQMRERIDRAIEEKLLSLDEKSSLFKRLKRQQMLLGNAQISTIHQFCLSVIRNNFSKINIDPAFRLGEEGEFKLLKSDVASEILERCYEEGSEAFYDFSESMCTGKNDDGLEDIIINLFEAATSHPDPDGWIDNMEKLYEIDTVEEFNALPEIKYLIEYKTNVMGSVLAAWNRGVETILSDKGLEPYMKTYNSDKVIIDALMEATDYSETVDAWQANKDGFVRLASVKAGTVDEELQAEVKECRNIVKNEISKLMEGNFNVQATAAIRQIKELRRRARMLFKLVREFRELYSLKKREKNLVDFDDLEHFTLDILLEKDASVKEGVEGFRMTAVADEYSEFFAEIMVDEYQDSNMVQEAIIYAVSGERFGKHNVFMVGDVKQSIYKFRMARPDLFLGKYNTFSRKDSASKVCIELAENYRSRRQVLSATNSIFEKIMNKRFGGIEYDDVSALKCGMKFEEGVPENVYKAEIHLAEREIEDEDNQKEDGAILEAKIIAGRIKELVAGMDGFKVWDKGHGAYRSCKYGDIVILLRSFAGRADTYAKVLAEEGIPAFSQSGSGYFDAYEVRTIINFLRILDNALDDIAFTAVIHSPIGKISSEELALIRIKQPDVSICEALRFYMENGDNGLIKEKLAVFFDKYEKLREMVAYMPLHKLIRAALRITGYDDYCAAMPAGKKRRMNLYMLVRKAVEFEGTSYRGLFNFIRYLDKLKKYDIDFGEANVTDAGGNGAVRIMTIHKSKGLEFPVVFLGGIGKRFNQQDTTDKVVIHADYGIGFDKVDVKRRTSETVFKRNIIKNVIKKENLEEELRVLYVALTRAIEKLVLVGSFEKLGSKLDKWQRSEADFSTLMSASSYADWILPFSSREFDIKIHAVADVIEGEAKRQVTGDIKREFLALKDAEAVTDEAARKLIEERFAFEYLQAASTMVSAAISVSELKHLSYEREEEEVEFLEATEETGSIVPRFIAEALVKETGTDSEKDDFMGSSEYGEAASTPVVETTAVSAPIARSGLHDKDTGMKVGTAYHTLFWKFDFDKAPDRKELAAFLKEMTDKGAIEPDIADRISLSKLLWFAGGELYGRMSAAHRNGMLRREQPFVLGMDAKTVKEEWPEGEIILVQGIIDAFFEEDGELVLVDYKTDRVSETDCKEVLTRRYKKQMELYTKALEQITGKRVKERILYSLAVGHGILV